MLNMVLESTPKQFTGLFFRRLPSQGSTPCLYCAPSVWAQRNNPANCFAVQSPCEIGTEWNERRYPSERMRRRRTKRKKASHSTCFSMVRHQGHRCFASCLLVHPNALHFGTGLRTTVLKTIINRFLDARCPLRVRVPLMYCTKNRNHQKVIPIFMVQRVMLNPNPRQNFLFPRK